MEWIHLFYIIMWLFTVGIFAGNMLANDVHSEPDGIHHFLNALCIYICICAIWPVVLGAVVGIALTDMGKEVTP